MRMAEEGKGWDDLGLHTGGEKSVCIAWFWVLEFVLRWTVDL